jgi:hypothetical protein
LVTVPQPPQSAQPASALPHTAQLLQAELAQPQRPQAHAGEFAAATSSVTAGNKTNNRRIIYLILHKTKMAHERSAVRHMETLERPLVKKCRLRQMRE